jgi:MFS family permease
VSFADRNIHAFVLFRIGFNTRFYYPVLAVMFLDYGLTLEQYTLLNAVWAAALVGFEVPSGALADAWDRRRLVQIAAALMTVEMSLLAFAPIGRSVWLFPLMILNRFLSGLAEAFASGADEALAYDSLKQENREGEWPAVLERLGRWQAVAFFVAMLVGAAVYDPAVWQRLGGWIGQSALLPRDWILRSPAFLTLGMAFAALAAALRLREPDRAAGENPVHETWRQIFSTGRWILHTPRVLLLIAAAMCLDSFVRLFMTMESTYLRWIGFPDWSFGILGAAFAIVSYALQPVARRMVAASSAPRNLGVAAAAVLAGLIGSAFGWKWGGLLFALVLGGAMTLTGFFLSFYLNQWTDSARRATVLSFKGLAFNLAYGTAGLGFALILRGVAAPALGEPERLGLALRWLPPLFVGILGAVLLAANYSGKKSR